MKPASEVKKISEAPDPKELRKLIRATEKVIIKAAKAKKKQVSHTIPVQYESDVLGELIDSGYKVDRVKCIGKSSILWISGYL